MPRKPGPADTSKAKVSTFVLPIAPIEEIDTGVERCSRKRMVEAALAAFVRQCRPSQDADPLARHLATPTAVRWPPGISPNERPDLQRGGQARLSLHH
jgi:hypothetical protein